MLVEVAVEVVGGATSISIGVIRIERIMIELESEDVTIRIFIPRVWTMRRNEVDLVTTVMTAEEEEEEAAVHP